jgi:hypothetical protein
MTNAEKYDRLLNELKKMSDGESPSERDEPEDTASEFRTMLDSPRDNRHDFKLSEASKLTTWTDQTCDARYDRLKAAALARRADRSPHESVYMTDRQAVIVDTRLYAAKCTLEG